MKVIKHPILKGNCYVLHSDFYHDILRSKDEIAIYPERARSLLWLKSGKVFEKTIVTESAELISTYDREKVWIWSKEFDKNGCWVNPDNQTFLCSFATIESRCLGFDASIPFSAIGETYDDKYNFLKELYSIS